MAALFESRDTNNPSPLKPAVPVFGIPSPIVQQKDGRTGESPSRRKVGSSSSVVGEYTVNPRSPPSRLRKSQTAGDDVDNPFSLSPTKGLSGTRTLGSGVMVMRKSVDSTASADHCSERSWVTVVPRPRGGAGSGSQTMKDDGKAKAVEAVSDNSFDTVASNEVVSHPGWKDSDIFWATKKDTNSPNDMYKSNSRLSNEEDSGSVLITRTRGSAPFESDPELCEQRGFQSQGRRIKSVVPTRAGPAKRIVSTVTSPTLLGNVVNRSLSGKKSGSETSVKGAPAEPEVDLSTAVASTSSGPPSGSWNGGGEETRHSATIETDWEDHTSQMRKLSLPRQGVETKVPRGDFVLSSQQADFSDLDMEIQQYQSRSGLSTPPTQSRKETSGASGPHKSRSPTAGPQSGSTAAREVPHSLYESFETPRGRAEKYAALSKDRIDGTSANNSTVNLASLNSASRKTTEAGKNEAPDLSPESVRRSARSIALHMQIQNLQLQLDQRTEEVRQLRRCRDTKENAKQNADICTLMDKLSEAEQESRMWRERAEAAERRLAMFKKITTRVINRRCGMTACEKKDESYSKGLGDSLDGCNDVKSNEGGKDELCEAQSRLSSNEMHTEDEGAIADRIRAALHGHKGKEHEQRVGLCVDGGYGFPAGEGAEHEGVWLDPNTKNGDNGLSDESSNGIKQDDNAHCGRDYKHTSSESSARFGSPSGQNSPGPRSPKILQQSSSGQSDRSWRDYYMNRPGGSQDTTSESFLSASTSGLFRGRHHPDVGTDSGPIDTGIDDDNRSSTTESLPGTSGTYRSALMNGLNEQDDSGMSVGDGKSISGSSSANMWIRAVEKEKSVSPQERAGEPHGEPDGET
ncbi:hypothetical protein V8F20_004697 [Naviculisporaceae sp. PSN 640]